MSQAIVTEQVDSSNNVGPTYSAAATRSPHFIRSRTHISAALTVGGDPGPGRATGRRSEFGSQMFVTHLQEHVRNLNLMIKK